MKSDNAFDEIYQRRRIFLEYIFDRHLDPKLRVIADPIVELAKMEESSPRMAVRGLATMVNDMVEMSLGWSPEQVARADCELRSLGAITLSELRFHASRKINRIRKKAVISNEDEFYLVKCCVDGLGSDLDFALSTELLGLLAAYESARTIPLDTL